MNGQFDSAGDAFQLSCLRFRPTPWPTSSTAGRLHALTQMAAVVLAGSFGFPVFFGHVSAGGLIIFSLLVATAAALVMPAWQAVVPQLVPRALLQPAVALNSIGLNVSRALGPALAGIVIAAWGMAAPFWGNSLRTAGG